MNEMSDHAFVLLVAWSVILALFGGYGIARYIDDHRAITQTISIPVQVDNPYRQEV